MTDIERLAADPIFFPHRYDASSRTFRFVRLTRDDHRAATFLDDEYISAGAETVDVPAAALAGVVFPPAPLHFIFHSAFCCSTLLARALDVPGIAFGLKEPKILNDFAAAAHRKALHGDDFRTMVALLGRPPDGGGTVIVKPSNEANILIDPLLRERPDARAVLLSSALKDFLLSIAKKGMWGRLWARRLHVLMRPLQRRDPGFSVDDMFGQTDLQIAAMVWLMHRSQFADLLAAQPDRLRSLDAADLLADKAGALARLADFLSLELGANGAAAIAAGGAFTEHAKERGRRYEAGEREAEKRALKAAHAEEIAMVARWAEAIAAHIGVAMTLGGPLAAA